jgi:hypothetical protein
MMFENFLCIVIIIISDSDKLFLFWSNDICKLGTPSQLKLHSNTEKDWHMKHVLTKTLVPIKQHMILGKKKLST